MQLKLLIPNPRRAFVPGMIAEVYIPQEQAGEAVTVPAKSRSAGGNSAAAAPAIVVENIVKRYGEFEAVKGVSFSVANGEIFGLLGPNGAGKSTLIRMMTTLIPITGGRAIVAGHDVSKEPDAVRRMIGVIPQALTSDPDLTVEENLSIYAKLYSVPRAERKKKYSGSA